MMDVQVETLLFHGPLKGRIMGLIRLSEILAGWKAAPDGPLGAVHDG